MSASSTPILRPCARSARARLQAVVDLPTPPLPEATAMTCVTPGMIWARGEGACAGRPGAGEGEVAGPFAAGRSAVRLANTPETPESFRTAASAASRAGSTAAASLGSIAIENMTRPVGSIRISDSRPDAARLAPPSPSVTVASACRTCSRVIATLSLQDAPRGRGPRRLARHLSRRALEGKGGRNQTRRGSLFRSLRERDRDGREPERPQRPEALRSPSRHPRLHDDDGGERRLAAQPPDVQHGGGRARQPLVLHQAAEPEGGRDQQGPAGQPRLCRPRQAALCLDLGGRRGGARQGGDRRQVERERAGLVPGRKGRSLPHPHPRQAGPRRVLGQPVLDLRPALRLREVDAYRPAGDRCRRAEEGEPALSLPGLPRGPILCTSKLGLILVATKFPIESAFMRSR